VGVDAGTSSPPLPRPPGNDSAPFAGVLPAAGAEWSCVAGLPEGRLAEG
jgi:hypothetical protein